MSRPVDPTRKKFRPLLDHTLHQAVAHRISQEFPRLGGPRMVALCADLVLEVVQAHLVPRSQVQHAQVLWTAVSRDEPPARHRRIADTTLVPVLLDLYTPEDIHARIDRVPAKERLLRRARRLCTQAYAQGGLLSNCDLEALLGGSDSTLATLLTTYERSTGTVIPRRATLHDVGTGRTHKRIICWKRYADGKAAEVIAQETYHSLEAVDRYLGQFARVRACRRQGLSPAETAFTLNCSLGLTQEYLAIDQELQGFPEQETRDR